MSKYFLDDATTKKWLFIVRTVKNCSDFQSDRWKESIICPESENPFVKGKRYIEVWSFGDLNSLVRSVEAVIKGCYSSSMTSFVQAFSRPGIPRNWLQINKSCSLFTEFRFYGIPLILRRNMIFSYWYVCVTTFPRSSETETNNLNLNKTKWKLIVYFDIDPLYTNYTNTMTANSN